MVDFFKFTEQLNLLHPTALLAMKFTAEVSDTETIFLNRLYTKAQHSTKNEKKLSLIDVKTHFKRKPSSIYIHRRKATLLKQNNEEEREILPFVTQYKPLVSIIKKALMKKCIISYKTNNYLAKFLKNHLTLGRTHKIIPPHHGTRGG